ncbi:DUF2141 domain-containing protein [Pedobacter arcticus]|uniref:DUF2141 domain-containing protein n=1 Tax=Pedobacter arcticus TaxID=752140 RepID=UPI0002F0A8F3|nr:DUF2141 domain-containing protein [Pedobacter arcticus]
MKLTLSILFSFLALHIYAQNPNTHDLKITVTNIKKLKGNIKLGIFNTENSFLIAGKEYKSVSKKVTDNEVILTLTDLPKGAYAISLFQDVNTDNTCNLNFLGIPIEPYAFSNNFKPKFSKPKFNDCDIYLAKDQAISIKLIN